MFFNKRVDYLFRKYDVFVRKSNFLKKVNYLIRKSDLFIQEYAKVTPKWDELTLFECFGGKHNSFSKEAS